MIRAPRPPAMWPLAAFAVLFLAVPVSAQSRQAQSVRDGVYTEAQSERGEAAFRQHCASCHTPDEFAGALFMRRWSDQPVGNLFELVRSTMPVDFPGGLTAEQYADVLAFFLKENGLPAGEAELPASAERLAAIVIQPPPSP